MAKIKHIAISSTNPDETAKFYKECFGLEEVGKLDGKNAVSYTHLTLPTICSV